MKNILIMMLILISFKSFSSWNRVPDQTIYINAKYDQESRQFYDITASGSDWIDISLIDGNQIKIKHGRDGYKGRLIPRYSNHRYARNTLSESRNQTLLGRAVNESFVIDVGRGNSSIIGIPTTFIGRNYDGSGCRITDTWTAHFQPYQVSTNKTNSIYSGDWCLGASANSGQYVDYVFPTDVTSIGFVERYFRFPLDKINNLPLDTYMGTYESSPTADVIRIGNSDLGREAYRYIISFQIKPSINSFTVDNENIVFSVNRQNNIIVGKSQTGFNIRGSFWNSQSFDIEFLSLNNALCGGNLCLYNSSSRTTLPYTVKVLDPSTLQEKMVSRSGQKVGIDADKNYQISGGIFFEFESDNTSLSGTFNDVATLRVELKL
ncbi:TPA: hypothetical protein I7152_11100 [Vibrio vulnificus]|nr:hypothetical protein [Vibrio vulnificus]